MKRSKSAFELVAQRNRLLRLFLAHGTSERNKCRLFRVLFERPILKRPV